MTITIQSPQKFAIFGAILIALISVLSSILIYEYKINSCSSALAKHYNSREITSSADELKYKCHALVNGAPVTGFY